MKRAIGRRMAHKCLVLLVVALSTSRALAGPLSDSTAASEQCSELCPASTNDKFSFDADQTYEYQYESNVKTSMGGASEEHSSLHLRTTAQFEVISKCEMVLRLTDVTMEDSNPSNLETRQQVQRSNEFKQALETRTLRFSFVDGHVQSICADQEEPVWVLNIKRGILSAFQNTMETLDEDQRVFETDVAGTCPTEYESKGKSWTTRTVMKTKDLIGCIDRSGPQSAFQGAPFQVPSDIQTLPVMKSTHECEQQINSAGILTQSVCKETHVFRPFSRQENGAKTEITTSLVFTKQSAGVSRQVATSRTRSSLVFDHTLSAEEQAENKRQAKKTLVELCAQSQNDIRPDVPSLFTKFVREIRKLETDDLSSLFDIATQGVCQKAEKFFRDAIPLIGTEASINLIRELTQSGRATEAEIDIWLTAIATSIHRPSKNMITTLKPMLNGGASRKTYLAISSLINNFCTLNEGCDSDADVQSIIRMFNERLRYNCRLEDDEQHDDMLAALKALGNTGHAESAAPTLLRCANNNDLSMELRVAALQAFRRMACLADSTELLNILENTQVDSELRIHAYLVLMACPQESTLQRVVFMLQTEEVNQVGSFIWTHLTNLQETSNPHKQQIRAILESEELKKTFDMDKRKFSRNIEMSLFSELLNMGGSVESNVIFSEKSYIPRSGMLNLTAELFGQSINFFEMGGRLQGMEQLLERFFAPEEEVSNEREKRSLIRDDSINMLDRSYEVERERMGVSYFLRMFGNEIRYGDLHNFDLSNIKEKMNFLEWLIELASEHDFEVTKSMMFLDLTHVIPTAAGLPLKLEADGAATVNVNVNGKMDIRRMFTSPSTFDISGSVKPSAALEVTSMMGIDAFVAKTGLKMVTTMHTSTVAQGKFQLTDGKIFNMDLDIPQDKVEFISAESKFFILYRDDEREQNMLNTGERTNHAACIGGKFTTVMGLELCGELSYPWDNSKSEVPFFPFTGPASGKVYLNKRDTYTGFHFEAKHIQEKTRAQAGVQIKDIARVQFNTPGSTVDREMLFDFEMDRANKQIKLNLKSPWKKADLNVAVISTEVLRSISASAVIDEVNEYSAVAQLTTDESENAIRYLPSVQIIIPGQENIVLDGSLIMRQTRKIDVNLELKNLLERPISLRGSIDKLNNKRRMKYGGEMEFSSSFLNGRVEGFVDHNKASGQSLASRMTIEYSYLEGAQQSIVLSNKIRDKSTDTAMAYSLDSAWRCSFWPRYDGEVSMDFNLGQNMISTNFQAGLDDVRKIVFSETATFQIDENSATVTGTARFQFPLKYMDYEVKLDHMHTTNELKTEGTLKSGSDESSLTLGLKKESSTLLKMTGEAKLVYPGRDMAWTQSIEEKNPNEYHHNLDIQLQKYETISLESVYKMIPIHDLSATLSIPEFEPMTLNARVNPDVNNLMVHVDTTGLGQTYSGEVTSIMRGSFVRNFAIQNGLSLTWPGCQVEANSEITRRNEVFSVNGETSWDSDSKVTVNGQMTMLHGAPALQIKVTWPQNFVSLDFEGVYQHQGWYTTEDDLQGNVHFTSSFTGLEDLSASLKHDMTNKGMKTQAEVGWTANQKVDAEFTLKKINGFNEVQTIVEVGTPFIGYKILKGELNYKINGDSLETTTIVQVENAVSQLALSGQVSLQADRLIRGTMMLTTPFDGFESITASLKHSDNGRNFKTNAESQWSDTGRISTQLKMNLLRRGYDVKNSGELVVATPFEGYTLTKISWTHENDDNKISHQTVVECESQRSLYELNAMRKVSHSKRTWEVKTVLQTPFALAQDIRMNIAHSGEINSWENVKSKGSLQYSPGKTISYEHELDANKDKLNLKSKVTSPITDIITLSMRNEIQEASSYAFKNELKYGDNKRITFESIGSMQEASFSGTSQITTPCPYFEKIVLNKELKRENGVWISHADLEYASGQVIEFDAQLGLDSVKAVSLSLKTPFAYVRDVSVSTKFEGIGSDFECNTEVNHHLLTKKIALLVKFDSSNLKRITGNVDFQSPFEVMSFAKGSFVHYRNNGGKILNKLSIELPQYQGSINNEMKIRGWQMHSSKTELKYMSGQKFEVAHDFSLDNKVEGKFMLKTPFDDLSVLALDFEHNGLASDFNTNAVVNYNGLRFVSETNFKLEGSSLVAATKVETAYNLIGLELTHSGDHTQFTNVFGINFNGKQMYASSEFALNNNEPTGRITVTTPYACLRSFNMNFEHSGKNWHNFENTGAFEYNGDRYTAGSEFKMYANMIRMKVNAHIPEEYSIKLVHKGESNDFTSSMTVSAGSNKIESSGSYKLNRDIFESSASIVTSIDGYENFEVAVNHEGPASNFKTSGSVVTPFAGYRRMGAEISYATEGSNLNTIFKISTPASTLPAVTISLSHQGGLMDFSNVLTAEYSGKTVEATTQFTLSNAITGTITLTTPYRNFENFVASFNHEGSSASFKTSANVETSFCGYEKMTTEYNHVATSTGFNCNGRFESSITNFTAIQLFIKHEMSSVDGLNSNIALETSYPGAQRFAVAANHRGSFNKMRSTGSMETPFTGFERLSFDINHDSSSISNIKSVATLSAPIGSFGYAAAFNGHLDHFKASVSVSTPFQHFNRYEITMDHTARSNIVHSARIISPNGEFAYTLEHEGAQNKFASSLQVSTPISGHKRYSFAVNHDSSSATSMTSFAEATLPLGIFATRLSHQGDSSNFNTKVEITTPFNGFNKYQWNLDHSARDSSSISTSTQLITPQGELSFALSHNGQPTKFETTITGTTPFEGYQRFNLNIDHDCSAATKIVSNVRLSTTMGDFSYGLNFNGRPNRMSGNLQITTPFMGFERFEISFNHNSPSWTDIATSVEMTLSSDRFSFSLNHKGDLLRFQNDIEITTPFAEFSRVAVAVTHIIPSNTSIDSQITVDTKAGGFALKLSHNGIPKNMQSSLELSTPFSGYSKMSAKMTHNFEDLTNLMAELELTTPIGIFKYDFGFSGISNDFRTNLVMTTPFHGYETISTVTELNVRDLSNIVSKSELIIPFGTFKYEFVFSGTSDDFTANLALSTPFYDTMSAKIEHNARSLSNIVSKSELIIPVGIFKYEFDFTGTLDDFRANLALSTPFYETMSIKMEHSTRDLSSIISKSELNIPFGSFKSEFDFTGTYNDFRANLVLSIPFHETMSAKIEHSGTTSKSELIIPVGIFKYDFTLSGSFNDFRANLVLSTPFSGYEAMSAMIEHSGTASKCELNIPVGIFKYDFTLSGSSDDFTANLVLSTPFSSYESMSANIEHRGTGLTNVVSKCELNIPVGIFKYDFTLSGSLQDFRANLILSTPFSGYESMSAVIEHSGTASKCELNIPVGIFKYDFTLSGSSNDFRANLVLSSPFSGYESMSAIIEYRGTDLTNFVSKCELILPTGTFKYDFSLSGSTKNFRANLVLSTPFSGYETMSALTELNIHDLTDIVSKSELTISEGTFKYDFSLSGSSQRFRANLVLNTPFSAYEFMSAKIEHSGSDLTSVASKSELIIPTGTFKYDFSLSSSAANLVLSTPFSGYETMSAKIEHNTNSLSKIVSKCELNTPAGLFKYDFSFSGTLSDFSGKLELSTPFRGFENMAGNLRHSNRGYNSINCNAQISLSLGQFGMSFEHENSSSQFSTSVRATSSIAGYEKIGASVKYSGVSFDEIKMDTPLGKFGGSFSNEGTLNKFSTRLVITTPFKDYEQMSISLTHDASSLQKFESAISITSSLGNFAARINHNGLPLATTFVVNTPFNGFEEMSLTFTLSGNSIQTFESIVTANMPVGQFRLSILSSSQSSSISLATPLRGYDMMSATLRKTDIESSLIFMTPIGEFQTAYKNQGILSSIVLVTPFRGYERMSASLSHSASSMTNILSTLSLDIPAGEFQVTLRHEGSLFRFTTSLEVMTPITGYERMSVSLHNSAENAAEIVSTITLNIPSGEYQLSFKHDGVDAKYTSALTMSTPYTGYERSSLVLRHSGFEDSSLSLNLPSGEYEVSLHNRGSHGQLSSSTTLKTPFQGYERVTFAIQHSASPSDMESSIAIELPTGQYKISAIREGHVSDFTFTIALTTPVIGYERMSATLRHSAPSLSSIKSALTIGEFQVSLDHAGIASEFLSTIAVDTPFSGYESMSISARHSAADRTNVQSAITLNIPSGEYQLSMDGNFVLPEYTVAMNIPDYERMFFTLSHSVSSAIVSFNIPCGHYEIKFDHEGAHDQFTSTISMKTPINGFERLATTVRHSARDVSNIDSTISAETPLGHFEIGVKHTGTAERFTSTLSVATPFGGFENIAATAVHSANDLTNIVSSLKFSTPIGQYGAAFSHQGTSLRFRTTIDITSPHSAWEKMTFTIENNSPASTNIEAGLKIELPSGEYAYSFSHQGSAKEFTTRYVVNTPNSNNYDFEALVDHSARSLADIKSKAAIRSYWGNIGYDIKHKGNQQNFKTDITVTTPFTEVEDMSVTIEHDANSLENIQSSTETNTPWGLFKYQVSYSGRAENFRTSLNINTPFRGYEEMFAAFEHAGRDLSSIKTTARFTMPMGVFSAGVDHTGNLRKFVTIVEVNTPLGEHNYRLHLDNNVVDVYNMLSKAMLTIPSGEFSSSVHYNGNPRRFSAAFDINTPFETFRKLEIVMNHAASDFSQITTSASILTPMGTYGYDIKHNGDWKRMTSTIGVTTPYTGYENNIISIEHDASSLNHLQTTIKSGTSQFALNHHGQLKKMRSSLEISLPFQGFEQTGIKVETNIMDLSKLKSAVSVTTPIGAYAYDLQFNGSPKAFTSVFELSTPHQKMNTIKATANVDVSSLSALRLGSELVTPVGQYGFRMTHDGNMQGFRNEAELTTPHTPYNKFAYGINFSLSKNFRLNGELTTSVPSYERFTLDINHDTRTDGFRSSVDATTTVPNYSRFVVSIEHTGSLQSPKTIVTIQTPFPGHDSYTLTAEKSGMLANLVVKSSLQTPRGIYSGSFSQTGSQNDFRTEATLTLPLSGFERFAFEMNHKGDSELSRSHVQISTPFRNWENFGVRLSHDARDNIRSSLTINTAYPGFEEIVAALTHEGTAQNFETDFQITTPFNGYRNFGFNVNHGGHVNEFSTRGTIKLPIVEIPATTIAISHRRELTDFQTSVSVEYNNKKIESEAVVKKSTGRSGNNYEGTFTMTSPYEVLQRIYVTGVHSRNGDIKTGSLDAMYNGHQMVDFDYSYNTGALKNVEIQIRKPYGMSSKVNAGGNNNDATFNWDTTRTDSQVHFDLNMKNEEAEKELTIRAVLPSRTVGFTTTYANAEGRLTHTTEVMWDNSADAKASYHVELSKTTRRSQNIFDGRLSFASPVGSMDATFNHISNPGRQSTTEISIQRLSLRSEAVMTSNGFKHTMTAEHPKLPSNLKLVIEGAFEAQSVDGTLELTFDSEVFTFVGHLSDASNYRQTLYNAKAQLTHPNSNLDAAWEAQYKDDSDIIAVIMNGKYLTSSDLEMKTASLRADINKLRKALDLEIITPVETLALTATEKSHDVEQGIHLFEIVCTLGEHSIRGDFNVNREDKMIEMKLYQDEDFLHLTAQMVSAIHAKAEVSTTVNGERRQHALASIAISEEHLISTRFLLSPTVQQEVTQFFNQIQTSATYHRMSNTVQAAVEKEIAKKKHQLTRAVQPFQPAIRFSIQQYTAIANGMQSAYDTIIQENHFHARDIITYVQSTLTDMSQNVDFERINKIVKSVQVTAMKVGQQVVQTVAETIVKTRPFWSNAFSTMRKAYLYTINTVRSNRIAAYAWDKFMTIDISDLINPIEQQRDNLMARLEPFKIWWSKIEARPETKYIKAHLKRTLSKTVWGLRYMEIDERVKEVLRELHHISLATYRSQLIQRIRDYLQLEKNAWSVWNPQGGEIGFDMYWPFHWDDLHHLSKLQDINVQKYAVMAKDMAQQLIPEIPKFARFNIYDYYYAYKPSSDIYNWVPPFKTYATVMGSQHYMTFDKTFYEFAGQCSYLLAHDFIDGTFSVVVNYEPQSDRPVKKSLSVITNNKQVEIFNDGRVVVDGSRVEMPLAFGTTTITRVGSMIRIDNTVGVTVDCNLAYDRCTVNVTGWYFGKTGGLFGTYNNEPSDDFTTAVNTRVETAQELADSWTAGQRCRPENFAVAVNPEPNTEAFKICSGIFEDTSSQFRPCFKIVDPLPFQKMCENDMMIRENRLPAEKDACNAASFYVDVCRREGVNIRVPNTCVRCEIENLGVEFTEGQNYTLEGESVPQSADVVFLLEHAECNQDVVNKLKDVVDDMEVAYKRIGITNNRYSIVGYGASGSLNAAHVRTMDGQIFNSHDKFLLGLDEFTQTQGESADALSAIFYASKLPFRAGVSKTFIIVPCSSCQEMSMSYADVEHVLLQKNIHLHMLMEHSFRLSVEKDPVSAYIFGADNQRVFTRKDAGGKDLVGDRELRQQVQVPKDLCAALALESDGSIFNTLQWTQSRPYMQKRFMDVMVRLIAEKGRPETCQKCDCVSDEFGVGRAVCKTCQSTRSFYSFLPGFEIEGRGVEEALAFRFEETEATTTASPRRTRKPKRKQLRQKQKTRRN